MADISKIILPNGTEYDIKDATARDQQDTYYGTCTTAAGTKDKVVTVSADQNFSLKIGAIVGVKFSYTNTYASATANPITLNVNSTGAKNIWYNTTHSGTGNTGTNTTIYGTANRYTWYMYDGTYWVWIHYGVVSNSNTVPSAQCETAAATAAKAASLTNHTLTANTYCHFNIRYANTAASAITMNVDSSGAKPIYINGTASSSSNHTLPAGTYIAFYNGTNWYFRTDGKLPADIDGDAATVNGHTVAVNVPSGAVFTDTQSDWNVTDTSSKAFIKNKPTIPTDFPPKNHASTATTYGKGTSTNYGHVKLSDTYRSAVINDGSTGADSGLAASQKALNTVYEQLLSKINSNFTVSLASSSWSSSTTTVNGTPYYTALVTASPLVKEYPIIFCGSSGTLPSKQEKNAFNLIDYAIADVTNHTITFYAVIKPTINLTINVVG